MDGKRKYTAKPQTNPVGPLDDNAGRLLRGGAFWDPGRGARCAYRDGRGPDVRLDYIGFRVVASPFFSGL